MSEATQTQWVLRLEIRTGAGEVQSRELASLSRSAKAGSGQEIGLTLAEAKQLLANLQQHLVEWQVGQHAAACRPCAHCQKPRPLKDYRLRRLQSLFGTTEFRAPRFKACHCQLTPAGTMGRKATVCPFSDLLPRRTTPELERLQAELGAKIPFREAARILATLLPTASTSHASVRNRLWAVAQQLETAHATEQKPDDVPADTESHLAVALDSAYVRATTACPNRHLEVITGEVGASGQPRRRFALVSAGTDDPHRPIRAALEAQGWHPGQPVTVLSDGDPSLPTLVRAAAENAPVEHVLDRVSPLDARAPH
ncbi:MAG: hypothetical protein JO069_19490 [Verrucomicrobia bacterium]|nr:hypothetical protein [Verrucomicrobiota bacterium]